MPLACYAGLKGPLPGHVVAVTTLLASGSVKPGGLVLKVKRPGALSRPGRFVTCCISAVYRAQRKSCTDKRQRVCSA